MSKFFVRVILSLILYANLIYANRFQCISYGQCHQTETGLYQNCVYKGPPLQLNHEGALKILRKRCPHLVTSDKPELCCDADQVFTLEENLRKAELVYKRCTSCVRNLGLQICDSTCATNQSAFMHITSTGFDSTTLKSYITGLEIFMTSAYMRGAYDSCSQVVMPATGRLVLDAACGAYDAAQCSHTRWFSFMGDRSANPYTPYNMVYKETNVPYLNFVPYNGTTVPCNKPFDDSSLACSCMDCEASCPVDFDSSFDLEPDWMIFGLDAFIVSAIIIYLSGFALCFAIHLIKKRRRKNVSSEQNSYGSISSFKFNSTLDEIGDTITISLENFFTCWGSVMGEHSTLVICLSSWLVAGLCHGVMFLNITSDPVELWSSPNSQVRQQKNYFDTRFQPFYRTEQVFIRAVDLPKVIHNSSSGVIEFGPVFNREFLMSVLELHRMIMQLKGLKDVCFAPLSTSSSGRAENLKQCTVQGIWGFFQDSVDNFNKTTIDSNGNQRNYLDHLSVCLLNSYSPECLAPFGGNVEPALAVGGLSPASSDYRTGSTLILTYIINNAIDRDETKPAYEWESKFLKLIRNWTENMKPAYMDVAYKAERSIEDELEAESQAEFWTIAISYLFMFIYVAFGLGTRRSLASFFIESKVTLGLCGVILVLLAVLSALGICSYFGFSSTLLIIEVIPFLVLAVGVDNMFIVVQAEQRLQWKPKESVADHVGRALGSVGPSILLSTITEVACFSIGMLTDMPAVRVFALYAMVALLIDFLLQMTVFIAFMALDIRRQRESRLDVLCCIQMSNEPNTPAKLQNYHSEHMFLNKYYFKIFRNKWFRIIVVILFWTCSCVSLTFVSKVQPGLDSKLSVAKESYLYKYLKFLEEDFTMGPPVYFVLKRGLDLSTTHAQNLVCGGLKCNADSVSMQIYRASRYNKLTYIARPASSWLDDFVDWSTVPGCCKYHKSNHSFCPHNDNSKQCQDCNMTVNEYGRPDGVAFGQFMPFFLKDNPDMSCAKGGHAAYGTAVDYTFDNQGVAKIGDTYFMAYHTTLKTSADYYLALRAAKILAKNITDMLRDRSGLRELEVFPYSIFYVFYDQYLNIRNTAVLSIGVSLLVAFLVSCILTGFEILLSLLMIGTVVMILVNMAGLMYLWNIDLNAVSLVNLVVAVGISVEFCSHIVYAFSCSLASTKLKRAEAALSTMGTSVFSGITMTKLIGISVLAFAKTQIIEVFYFRMYFEMVVLGALHSLLFLPVLLSIFGTDNPERRSLRLRRISNPDLRRRSL